MIRLTIAGVLLLASWTYAATPSLRIAILGNPVTRATWNDENVQALVQFVRELSAEISAKAAR